MPYTNRLLMDVARQLVPDGDLKLETCAKFSMPIAQLNVMLTPWLEQAPTDSYGRKPFLNFDDQPMFAELAVLGSCKRAGGEGVWVDSYRRKYRQSWPGEGISLDPSRLPLLQAI